MKRLLKKLNRRIRILPNFFFLLFLGMQTTFAFLTAMSCEGELLAVEADLSHTEGKGVGVHEGYTSLDLMFVMSKGPCFPFVDLRGVGFNHRKTAASGGLGLRYVTESLWIWGVNAYYDYRQGDHHDLNRIGTGFQQVGLGFEALGPLWDFRCNLYYPVGVKESRFNQISFQDPLGQFPIIRHRRQSTMQGFDAEVGAFVWEGFYPSCCFSWDAYLAAGTYYFDQKKGGGRFGGKVRLHANIARYFFFEARAIYDHVAHGSVQAVIGVHFPFYPFASEKISIHESDSSLWPQLKKRLLEPVQRLDVMPLRSWK